jgi:hypothetical protein
VVTDGGNGHAGDGAVLVVSAHAGDFVWRARGVMAPAVRRISAEPQGQQAQHGQVRDYPEDHVC